MDGDFTHVEPLYDDESLARNFDGEFPDVELYDVELTSEQVKDLYEECNRSV